MNKSKFKDDFNSFKNSPDKDVPKNLQENILKTINLELNPPHTTVFFKLITIQAFIGFITLLFCPQFNLSLTKNYDLFHYFHYTFGSSICMMICGSIFIGTGAIFATTILKVSELRMIRRNRFLYYVSITGIFISTLMVFGAQIYLESLGFWIIGALISANFILELNRFIHNGLIKA